MTMHTASANFARARSDLARAEADHGLMCEGRKPLGFGQGDQHHGLWPVSPAVSPRAALRACLRAGRESLRAARAARAEESAAGRPFGAAYDTLRQDGAALRRIALAELQERLGLSPTTGIGEVIEAAAARAASAETDADTSELILDLVSAAGEE